MSTIDDIRHANFMALLAGFKNLQAFADAIERSNSQVSQLKNRSKHSKSGEPREIGDAVARHIEEKLGKPRGWLDKESSAVLAKSSLDAQAIASLFDKIQNEDERDRFRAVAEHYAQLAIGGELIATLDAGQRAWPGPAPSAEHRPPDALQTAKRPPARI